MGDGDSGCLLACPVWMDGWMEAMAAAAAAGEGKGEGGREGKGKPSPAQPRRRRRRKEEEPFFSFSFYSFCVPPGGLLLLLIIIIIIIFHGPSLPPFHTPSHFFFSYPGFACSPIHLATQSPTLAHTHI